jgi:uncharacterized iron-regulated membrane protein
MIAASFLGIFIIPGFYVLFQPWREWARKIAAASAKRALLDEHAIVKARAEGANRSP